MSAVTPLAVVFVLLAAVTVPQSPPSIDEFRQLERKLADSYMKGDRASVDDLLADDWTSTDYRGRIWIKANVLALFDPGGPAFTRVEIDVDKVRVLSRDVAIVTGRSVSAGRLEGRDIEVVQRYTDVFVRQGGRWQVVASQGTQVQ